MSARKGVLGGTFNPPHVAHLIVAQEVAEVLELEQVLLVPTARHAFKGDAAATPAQRATMAELAVAGDPRLAADRLEVERGGVSYTVDTLRELRRREPATEWHLILGRDNLAELDQWREAGELERLARLVAVSRGSGPPEPESGTEAAWIPVPRLEISSTAVRERVAAGLSIRHWVPPAVEAFIRRHGLYGRDSLDSPPPAS